MLMCSAYIPCYISHKCGISYIFLTPSLPSFSLPHVLCDPTDLIWREATSFEAMTAFSDGLLTEVFVSFSQL